MTMGDDHVWNALACTTAVAVYQNDIMLMDDWLK